MRLALALGAAGLWTLGGWTHAFSDWIAWAVIEFPAGLVAGRVAAPEEVHVWWEHGGRLPLAPEWVLLVALAFGAGTLLARWPPVGRIPGWVRGRVGLSVLFFVFYRALVIAPPPDLWERSGHALVLAAFVALVLARPGIVRAG